jgi:hypothetical protein
MTWCNVAIHNAVATSAALGFPIALANVVGYVMGGQSVDGLPAGSLGYMWLPALGVIATCSVLTAPSGRQAPRTTCPSNSSNVCLPVCCSAGRLHALEGRHEGLIHLELLDR